MRSTGDHHCESHHCELEGSPNTYSVPGNPNRGLLAGESHMPPSAFALQPHAHPADIRNSWASGQAWGTENEGTQPTATSRAPGKPGSALSRQRVLLEIAVSICTRLGF